MKLRLIKTNFVLALITFLGMNAALAQNVTITVNAAQGKRAVSPNIYGRNESFDQPVAFYKGAGLRFVRVGGGNNMSAYNWRLKLDVHPDWFNNVYASDWDVYAQKINDNFPNMQGMFAFQLLGRVASSGQNNFPDWTYMQAHPGWSGNNQNLAGGGTPDPKGGGKALVEGNIDLFSKPWPADSSVAILDHWFGAKGKGFNKNQLQYWSMDNEVDVWNGTHDWAMPTLISASAFLDRYIELAKKAKALYPDIKLCGPVTTSEWQWYKWSNESIRIDGKYYCWFEYFIKRCADEEKASGVRVLDVFDIHHYPYGPTDNDALQNYRIFYDKNYNYPGANGLYSINGGWDTSSKKEYVFQRINDWLTKYFGANNGITLGLSEWSPGPNEPNLASVIYATHLGTFANNGVEYFTPWNWFTGMWESLHLYSRYAKNFSVSSTSTLENTVSAYTTVNAPADSMTVILVNRDMSAARTVTINLNEFSVSNGSYKTLQLSSLPAAETFKSHTSNALKSNTVIVASNSFDITVPALSTTAVILKSGTTGISEIKNPKDEINIFPNPANNEVKVSMNLSQGNPASLNGLILLNSYGQTVSVENLQPGIYDYTINTSNLPEGVYLLKIGSQVQKLIVQH
ncbi:MAG TPA: secretion protein Por [Prolixibacteraceae bacterium]|jgi:hypothetical protein|nr:secretion protein Por [Prolixibacteraceae bacterium]